jgi:hypothetical protein
MSQCSDNGRSKIARREPAANGDETVVPTDAMIAQRHGRDPEQRHGEATPLEIADDHAHARHTVELLEEARQVAVEEVVKHLRADHDVDTLVGKG